MTQADDMYQQSQAAYKELPPDQELPPRVWNALARSGFVEEENGKRTKLNIRKLREAILNGKIWKVRHIGKKTVRLLCEFLEQNEQNKAADKDNEMPTWDTPRTERHHLKENGDWVAKDNAK